MSFLQHFSLFNGNVPPAPVKSPTKRSKEQQATSPLEKLRRLPRRSRAVMGLSKCPTIAISSPAGKQLLKSSKTVMSNEYLMERLDRSERFCHAPALSVNSNGCALNSNRPKFLDKKFSYGNISISFKRPPDYHYHYYKFPRRQFSQRSREEAFLSLNAFELKQCSPVSINVKKLTNDDIVAYDLKRKQEKLRKCITISKQNNNVPAVLTQSNVVRSTKVVDFIDLCSSEDDEDDLQYDDIDITNEMQTKSTGTNELNYRTADLCMIIDEQTNCTSEISSSSQQQLYMQFNSSSTSPPPASLTLKNEHIMGDVQTFTNSNLLDGTLSQTAATPCSNGISITAAPSCSSGFPIKSLTHQSSSPLPLQLPLPNQLITPPKSSHPSVFIFSKLTQTTLSLAGNKKVYKYQNQENNCSFLNGAKSSSSPELSTTVQSTITPTGVIGPNLTSYSNNSSSSSSCNINTHNNNNTHSTNNNSSNSGTANSTAIINSKLISRMGPDISIEKVSSSVIQTPQQISIDLT